MKPLTDEQIYELWLGDKESFIRCLELKGQSTAQEIFNDLKDIRMPSGHIWDYSIEELKKKWGVE